MGDSAGKQGVSRRDLLKRSAVVGGVVWAAPALLSGPLAGPAGAQTAPCTDCPPGSKFGVKHNNEGSCDCEAVGDPNSPGTCVSTQPNSGCCLEAAGLIQFSGCNTTTHTYVLQPGVIFCEGAGKGAGTAPDACTAAAVQTNTPSSGQTTVIITSSTLSHSELVVCVPGTKPANCVGS